MKTKNLTRMGILIVVAVILLISGCKAGVSKEDRLAMFKADIIAGDNPKEHFGNRPAAVSIDYATITTIGLDNTSGNTTVFTGQTISGNNFTLFFDYTPSGGGPGADFVDGIFYSEDTGVSGEDWYIYSMTDSSGVVTIP